MNKKIALITSVASMIKQFNLQNIKILKEYGYEVTVITNFKKPGSISSDDSRRLETELKKNNISTYNIEFHRNPISIKNFFAFKQLKRINETEQFDLIHCQSPIGGAIARLVKTKKQQLIYTAHGFHFFKGSSIKNWLIFYPIEKILSCKTDVLLTINQEDYEFSKKYLNSKKNILIPGVGINIELLSNIKKITKEELGFSKDDFLLIYGAELNANKNQIILIEAMKKIQKLDENVKLILVGKGNKYDELYHILKKNNLETSVFLLGYRSDINSITAACDVAVASSIREGLGMFVLEAMYLGLPVIASDNRGHRTIIKNEVNGYLLDLKEFSDLMVDAVLKLKEDKITYKKFRNESMKIGNKYTSSETNQIMKVIYKETLGEK